MYVFFYIFNCSNTLKMSNGNPLQITNYIMLYKNENDPNHKKNKKKLSKKGMFRQFNFVLLKYNDSNILQVLKKGILDIIKKKDIKCIGVIFDTNIIVHDITFIPPINFDYQVICLEANIKNYKKISDGNLYYKPVEINSTGNFVINQNIIKNLLNNIDKCKTLIDFYNVLNNCNIFCITQYQISENKNNYIQSNTTINNTLTLSQKQDNINKINKEYYQLFQNLDIKCTPFYSKIKIVDKLLPKVSLVCPLTDPNRVFHTLLTFLHLDYPSYLLELLIIDDKNSEKKINLPNDSRIRFISLAPPKDKSTLEEVSFAYKLNIGAKHASHEIIMHFFDTHNYNPKTFKQNIITFLKSNKECLISNKTAIYPNFEINVPDIGNMIYLRSNFWSVLSFEDQINTPLLLVIYKFLYNRLNLVSFIPFVSFSFRFAEIKDFLNLQNTQLPFELKTIIHPKLLESFNAL
jgi:hypothetical protein